MLVVDGLNIPYFPTAVNGSGRVYFGVGSGPGRVGARSGRGQVGSGPGKKKPRQVNAGALVIGSLTGLDAGRPTGRRATVGPPPSSVND